MDTLRVAAGYLDIKFEFETYVNPNYDDINTSKNIN